MNQCCYTSTIKVFSELIPKAGPNNKEVINMVQPAYRWKFTLELLICSQYPLAVDLPFTHHYEHLNSEFCGPSHYRS
jgi:heme/copper-type cytochrome/quinol oxidase subunit 2